MHIYISIMTYHIHIIIRTLHYFIFQTSMSFWIGNLNTRDRKKQPAPKKNLGERHPENLSGFFVTQISYSSHQKICPEKMTQKSQIPGIINSLVHKSTSMDRPYKVGPNQL